MFFCSVFFCVLLSSGLYNRLITRPEESYRVRVCLIVCDLETSQTSHPALDLVFALEKKDTILSNKGTENNKV